MQYTKHLNQETAVRIRGSALAPLSLTRAVRSSSAGTITAVVAQVLSTSTTTMAMPTAIIRSACVWLGGVVLRYTKIHKGIYPRGIIFTDIIERKAKFSLNTVK